MRAPVSWLAEHVALPKGITGRQLADALIRVGLEVERVESGADDLTGPIVVGRVLSAADEPQKNGKTIRWCSVDVGEDEPRGIVCGAHNFAVGDLVVVSLPGAVLPGGFAIAARKTYGHVSDGMICSVRELGMGEDHAGILVLPAGAAKPGDDALDALGLRETVLDIAVTTDRGYCLSIRGLARECAAALGVGFTDITADVPAPDGGAYEVRVGDPGCDRFAARAVVGLDPAAPTPEWMLRRLRQCGMRSISLAVDVTNYVMLETGQPLHAFDRAKLRGPIVVRRARSGETLTTLDGVTRTLSPDDLVVTDASGPIALAGVMGGAATEIGEHTTDIVLEAAHWAPSSISRTVRRHRLPSEAARRFERGVDPEIADVALARCVELLTAHGGAQSVGGHTVVGTPAAAPAIQLDARLPGRVAGMAIARPDVIAHLHAVGCAVGGVDGDDGDGDLLRVQPPPWRPDLLIPADLVEEVVRLAGYDKLPSILPSAPAGAGLTGRQQLLRGVTRALAGAGFTEVLSFPFVSPAARAQLAPSAGPAAVLVNPISADEPELRTSLLPGLVAVALRNIGRGNRDLAVFETGLVFLPKPAATPAPLPGVGHRPTETEIAALDARLPDQPRRIAAVLCGAADPAGWWGPARPSDWADAIEAARVVARAARTQLTTRPVDTAPWHPGRCAALVVDERVIGHAGELHPRVVAALGLPERTCAMELDLDVLPTPQPAVAPSISGYPPVLLDVALVVPSDVPAAEVERTLHDAAGPLLESINLFDVYADADRLGDGVRSLAFALRFRAADRTMTVDEATAARDAAVSVAADRHGATLRS
ncbi:phenylalanine--tRNA ligase subunit beta [uncultured Jatrophihabitans sp.]|uniref:phenylalanine--tRNA ligase subunit beta n=1 Tax=uncultured Jatrophihabitans sp. TaxID=1610747 RepID=UPI0035CC6FB5